MMMTTERGRTSSGTGAGAGAFKWTVVLLALLLGMAAVCAQKAHAAARPDTIPALKEWTDGGSGTYKFNSSRRIVFDSAYSSQLSTTAATFADDLHSLSGWTIPVAAGASSSAGDIFISLNAADSSLGTQGYKLTIGDRITIQANNDTGAFYGTRTVLQLLKQSYTIGAGTARDWPDYPERGLMVDLGRKYYSVTWLQNHIRELSYLKYNMFHLHLTDNEGFRLESSSHPEVVSAQHYTKAEIASLVQLAAQYHITIIPEIDMPGHMGAILNAHPELKMVSNTGAKTAHEIDLTNDASYTLINDLFEEYIPLFPGPYFHIGADEYLYGNYAPYPQMTTYAQAHYGANATARDTVLGFINWADAQIKAHGKTTRMWNDMLDSGTAVTINPDVQVEYWNGGNPQQAINEGYEVINANWTRLYYPLNRTGRMNPSDVYQNFEPYMFNSMNIASLDPHNLGAYISIWCDEANKETESEVEIGVQNSLRSLAQKDWGSPKLVPDYYSFLSLIRDIGTAPGFTGSSKFVIPGDLALGKTATASSSSSPRNANRAVDGNFGGGEFRWLSAAGGNQWLQVDLGATYDLNRVVLDWWREYATAYQIQVSNDAVNWTTIYSTTTGDGNTDDLNQLTGRGRYVRMNATQGALSTGYSVFEMQAFGTPALNRALNRPATASSIETASFPANLAVDGNASTRWSSAHADPQWLQIDLGIAYNIDEVILNWETAYGKSYDIQVSDDGTNWTTIYSTTTGDGGKDDLAHLSGSGRYIRMLGHQRATSYGYSLYELQVFGTPRDNLALNRPATASSIETASFPANLAVDGNASTRWSSAHADPQWLQVDLGAVHTISDVILKWETAYGKSYALQLSNDGANWMTIYSTTSGDGGTDELVNLSGSGRYVRVYGTERATKWGYSLYEFQVYGS